MTLACPKCSAPTILLSGADAFPGNADRKTYTYHVCQGCRLAQCTTTPWEPMGHLGEGKRVADGWLIHTAYHHQMRVDGDLLDHWPTTGKFRYRGETHVGDVHEFLKGLGVSA